MINLVFTLVSAILGLAMFAVVLFSNAAEASAGTVGGSVKSEKSGAGPRAFSLMAIDDVRTGGAARTQRATGRRADAARRCMPTGLQMAAQNSDKRSRQL